MRTKLPLIMLALGTLLFASLPARAVPVSEIKTPGGLTAWLSEARDVPALSLRLTFKDAGAAQDPDGKEGRALLVTELLLEGAGKRDALTFAKTLEEHGIRIGIDADQDYFTITLKTLSEHRALAFELLADILTRPRLEADAVAREKSRALIGLKMLETRPEHQLKRAFRRQVFGTHPYARPEEGTQASVGALSQEDFRQFIQRHLTRDRLVISAAGDIAADELATLLDSALSALPASATPERNINETSFPAAGSTQQVDFDIPQTMVMFGFPGLAREAPDYLTAHVMNQLLGGGTLNSRLGKAIREERGLAYGVTTWLSPMRHAALLAGNFSTRTDQADDALAVLKDTLEDFRRGDIPDSELEDAKRYLTGSFVLGLDTNAEVAALLSTMQLFNLGIDYIERRNALIDAVTKDDVAAMAARLLDMNRLTLTRLGKAPAKKDAP